AVEQAGAQLVLSSEAAADCPGTDSGNVLVVRYAPQLQLLEHVDVFLTHGGANSVMEAMYAGTPLLIVPLSGDQPWQAHFVEERGVGIHLERDRFSKERCAEALSRLWREGSEFQANARQVRESYRKENGAREAANWLLRLAEA